MDYIELKYNDVKWVVAHMTGDSEFIKKARDLGDYSAEMFIQTNKIGYKTMVKVMEAEEDCEQCPLNEVCDEMELTGRYGGLMSGIEVGHTYSMSDLMSKYAQNLSRIGMEGKIFSIKPLKRDV